jgi:hypothetical protein
LAKAGSEPKYEGKLCKGDQKTAVARILGGVSFNFIPAMLEPFPGSPENLGFRREE